ncbi:thiol-disulfide oxidoreductase DCC family protein [Salinigranum rubrum]|uniref:Thiol-disulfide oxidoreductase DCC family protein n=1 Tax=Salinigranum rubrum TaxID=755307 RepID=A0A2I8VFD0_9EURY|nr:thiol-disulfide oxidoreductase DCC family protein [Salinigranum rubrum]AUV80574.1 thiol-disulfide oxidoreductase DCC family protein [Salinigranum rubrum]
MTERTGNADDPAVGSDSDAGDDTGGENTASVGDASTGGSADVSRGGDSDVDLAAVVDEGPVLLFDGVCNLCNGAVQFVIERDPEGKIRFASLQSAVGQAVLDRLDLPTGELETVVLLEGNRAYTRSAAAVRVCELLGGPYRAASVGWLLPRRVRDRLYAFVAEHRYEWFGRKDQCTMPTPELRERFVE